MKQSLLTLQEVRPSKKMANANLKIIKSCGMKLCPNRFAYITRPEVLDEIFVNSNASHIEVKKRPSWTDDEDLMVTMHCQKCSRSCLVRADEHVCISCRADNSLGGSKIV